MAETQKKQSVYYEEKGEIGVITINRPNELNALNLGVIEELGLVIDRITNIPRCLIIRGEGTKAFVAGADIAEMKDFTKREAQTFALTAHEVFGQLEAFPAPVIAQISGYALGGGAELALCCDFRIASDNAVFAFPETGLGIMPGFGGTYRLPQLIGMSRAKEMIYTGRYVKAEEALQIGLVNKVCAPEELEKTVEEFAAVIAAKAPYAVRAAKRAINAEYSMAVKHALLHEAELFAPCYATEDQKEGMTAFLEKREPAPYKGR